MKYCEIEYVGIEKNKDYEKIITKVLEKCFEVENMSDSLLYIGIMLTTPEEIKKINKEFRNIDKETDVLSFPMFDKKEIEFAKKLKNEDTLGDIIISIERVYDQAEEYGHSLKENFHTWLYMAFII